jgi:hypothetical protein
VRPAARRDPIDAELQAVMAESLALALRRAYADWLRANITKTRGPDELMAGLGMFVGSAADGLLGWLGLPAAEETRYVESWLTLLREAMADAASRRQITPDDRERRRHAASGPVPPEPG